jgi:hypothetical protein
VTNVGNFFVAKIRALKYNVTLYGITLGTSAGIVAGFITLSVTDGFSLVF